MPPGCAEARCDLPRCVALGDHGCLGVDSRFGGHARTQQPGQAVVVERDLHGDALHDLGEIAGRVIRGQQREFEAAGRRQAIDMSLQPGVMETVDRTSTGWPLRT